MPLLNLTITQFLLLFVAANTLRKLTPSILFLRWLAAGGLRCYKVPESADLKRLQYKERGESASKKHHPSKSSNKTNASARHAEIKAQDQFNRAIFKIKSADLINLKLQEGKISPWLLETTPRGDELEKAIDFAIVSFVSFSIIELIFYFGPQTGEYNFSLIWIVQVILQCLYILAYLTQIYFKNEESVGERSVCVVAACLFLLIAMLVMTLDGNHLELGLSKAISETWTSQGGPKTQATPTKSFLLDPDELDTPPPTPPPSVGATSQTKPTYILGIKLLVAVLCSLVGAMFTFPGFRFGQLHDSLVNEPGASLTKRMVHNFNYLSPVVAICLWVPALSREPLKRQQYFELDDAKFEFLRTGLLVALSLFRLSLVRIYVETFLQSGAERINRLRYKAGFTTNREVQVAIAQINNYVNIAAMQYMLPTLICLSSTITYAAFTYRSERVRLANVTENDFSQPDQAPPGDEMLKIAALRTMFGNQTFVLTAEHIVERSRQLLASDLLKNLFSFATWWFHFAWFCSTTAGVGYRKYFTH